MLTTFHPALSPRARMRSKIANMSNQDLRLVWNCLYEGEEWCGEDLYSAEGEITMDEWADALYNELDSRGMKKGYLEMN